MPPAVAQEAQSQRNKTCRRPLASASSTIALELERLQLLAGFEIIKSCPQIDHITAMVARLFQARHVSVTLHNELLGRAWTVSSFNKLELDLDYSSCCRSAVSCFQQLPEQFVRVAPDTDPRFQALAKQEPSVQFLAEASLVSNGYKVCVS